MKRSISYMCKKSASEIVREFPSFYEIKSFIVMLTRPCHRVLQALQESYYILKTVWLVYILILFLMYP